MYDRREDRTGGWRWPNSWVTLMEGKGTKEKTFILQTYKHTVKREQVKIWKGAFRGINGMKYNVELVRKFLESDPDLHIDENPDLEGVHSITIWWKDKWFLINTIRIVATDVEISG